jgi:hypothetical protein
MTKREARLCSWHVRVLSSPASPFMGSKGQCGVSNRETVIGFYPGHRQEENL